MVNLPTVLLTCLLRRQHQPVLRGGSWRLSIQAQRVRLAQHLDDSPSLRAKQNEAIAQAHQVALIEAKRETGFPYQTFPAKCPFRFAEVMDDSFWPD